MRQSHEKGAIITTKHAETREMKDRQTRSEIVRYGRLG